MLEADTVSLNELRNEELGRAAESGGEPHAQVLFCSWSLDREQLVALPLSEDLPALEVGVAVRRGAPVSPETEAFLAVAREHGRDLLAGLGIVLPQGLPVFHSPEPAFATESGRTDLNAGI